jgi:hypothetical protein
MSYGMIIFLLGVTDGFRFFLIVERGSTKSTLAWLALGS